MNTNPKNISHNTPFYEGSKGIFEHQNTMLNYLKMPSYDQVQKNSSGLKKMIEFIIAN